MSEFAGQLVLSATGYSDLYFDTFEIQESFSKTTMTTPIVSLGVESTFGIDMGTSKTYSIKFTRNMPESISTTTIDSRKWSNGNWIDYALSMMNRWQARTNGFKLEFTPSDVNPYVAPISEIGYIRNFTFNYSNSYNTIVSGSFEFHVGTMYVGSVSDPAYFIPQSDFQVSVGGIVLLSKSINCITSYSLYGGPESPFEYAVFSIPKNRLTSVAPSLVESKGIILGKTQVVVSAIGSSHMTVTKCKLRNSTYQITAYCNAEAYRGLISSTSFTDTPYKIIESILSGRYGGPSYAGNTVYEYDSGADDAIGTLTFGSGVSLWYILQVCALCLGCRIWFSWDKAYVVDTRMSAASVDYDNVDLYPSSKSSRYYGRISDTVSLGDEGTDTIINSIVIKCKSGDSMIELPIKDEDSIDVYKERGGNTLTIKELSGVVAQEETESEGSGESAGDGTDSSTEDGGSTDPEPTPEPSKDSQAGIFGTNFISYRAEPQQSISFTFKELTSYKGSIGWAPLFVPNARATSIIDLGDDVTIDNESDLGRGEVYPKLMLSTYEYCYPQGTTTYTWGTMASIDLASSTSQIVTAQNNS